MKNTTVKKNDRMTNGSNGSDQNRKSNGSKQNGKNNMLETFFVASLKDVYWAEKHLVKALPKMMKAATTEELKNAFEEHKQVTEEHVARVEQAFGMLGQKATAKKCEAIEGITKEAESIIGETKTDTLTRDVGLIMAAQKAEHYEIATYGGIIQLAKTLGHEDVATLLHKTLDEEKEADETLTQIAESCVNVEAAEE